jgi:hypothetical protein
MRGKEKNFAEWVFIDRDSDDIWMRTLEEAERRDSEEGWFS